MFAASPAQPQVLHGHVRKITKNLKPVGRLDGKQHLKIAIGLPLRNREQLTNLLEDIYNPSSPTFRHFLTADEFTAKFGPTAEDYQAVIDFAKAHHLKVDHAHPNRTLVDMSGEVADIEGAFDVHLHRFKHPKENREFFAPDAEPSLNLKTPVLAISGLDSYVKPTPRLHHSSALPAIRPMGGGGTGGGTYTGPYQGYQFRDAYIPDLWQEGEGQMVGLFELYGYQIKDIEAYEDESGISHVPVESVLIDGATDDDSNALDADGYLGYALETTGDIEMAIAMAPSLSKVLVYIGPTPQDQPPLGTSYIQDATTTAHINDVLNRMATDNLAKQLSCSYGMDINLSTVQIFQQFAAQGQSFFLASGDAGAFASATDEPADDPYITVVGGTTLSTDTNGFYKSETAWLTPAANDPLTGSTPEYATGGGVSTAYAIPSWQQGISMTVNQGSTTMRNVPDVALVANRITITWGWDLLLDEYDLEELGTSLAAPLWAGFMAAVNQQAALDGKPPIGFLNPTLYAIAKSTNYLSSFHDITTGKNTNAASPTKYAAVSGYDLCTGLGTINSNLFSALLSPPVDRLLVMSQLGFTSFGKSGGPFSVTGQTYTLANTGSTPLTWHVSNNSSWLNVSATDGTLNPGATTTVTVSLNANANAFMIMHASANIAFNNITTGTTQNRLFDLFVGNGDFENGSLDYWTFVGDPAGTFALAADDLDVAGQEALDGQPDPLFVHAGIYGGYLGEPDSGSLSQTVPTIPGQKLLVSFWLTSVPDGQNETTPNSFTAKWNGSTLFTGTDLPEFGWTNMQYIVSSAGASGTLEFDYNNSPGAFGLDDVTVQPIPGPVLYSATVGGGNMAFNWNAIVNGSYQIQSSINLTPNSWANVGGSIVATNPVEHVSLPMGSNPTQFYRVVQALP